MKTRKSIQRAIEINSTVDNIKSFEKTGGSCLNIIDVFKYISESATNLYSEGTSTYVSINTFAEPNRAERFWQVWLSLHEVNERSDRDVWLKDVSDVYEGSELITAAVLLLSKLLELELNIIRDAYPSLDIWEEDVESYLDSTHLYIKIPRI